MGSDAVRRRVLVVSGGDKIHAYFSELLPASAFSPIVSAHSAGEAKRLLLASAFDILIIDTPLPDELGVQLAQSVADMSMGIMLLVKSELAEKVGCKLESLGVLTLPKPNSRQVYYGAARLLSALSVRLQRMDSKNRSLQEKMADIRAVNRAKWLLIERLGMSETDAHHFIEKRAMDERLPRREIAENIIRSYDN